MKLCNLFSEGAVLQHGKIINIWGKTSSFSAILCNLAGKEGYGMSGINGDFIIRFPALPSGGPYIMKVTNLATSDYIEVKDIMIGEVWLASGQSNMEFRLDESPAQYRDFLQNIDSSMFRLFDVPRNTRVCRETDIIGKWLQATPENAGKFSAIASWFAKGLVDNLERPIGIICSAYGGTPIESWTSIATLLKNHDSTDSAHEYLEFLAKSPKIENIKSIKEFIPPQYKDYCLPCPENKGYELGWADSTYDDSKWEEISIPGSWMMKGISGLGTVWHRRTVDIPEHWCGKDLIINMGGVDKHDICYFNGVEIGRTGHDFEEKFWNVPRHYKLSAALVKSGTNILAVRAFSFVHFGGMGGTEDDYYIEETLESEKIPISGKWRVKTENNFDNCCWFGYGSPLAPAVLFDTMIRPLIPFTFSGILWYQGESNTSSVKIARQYKQKLQDLIDEWRFYFEDPNLPFIIVQIANYLSPCKYENKSVWAILRESQRIVANSGQNTGLIPTIDCGDESKIHPSDKKTPGLRSANWALKHIYNFSMGIVDSPMVCDVKKIEDNLHIIFNNCEDGLIIKNNTKPSFYVLDTKKEVYIEVNAVIKNNTAVLKIPNVISPQYVRYAWATNPTLSLFNSSKLPVIPFEISLQYNAIR